MVKLNEEVVIDNINVFQVSSALRILVKNPVKKSFYRKRKKKVINILTVFFSFSIKMMSKFSLIEFLISTLRALVNISLHLFKLI